MRFRCEVRVCDCMLSTIRVLSFNFSSPSAMTFSKIPFTLSAI